jgi:hypothetical protein
MKIAANSILRFYAAKAPANCFARHARPKRRFTLSIGVKRGGGLTVSIDNAFDFFKTYVLFDFFGIRQLRVPAFRAKQTLRLDRFAFKGALGAIL